MTKWGSRKGVPAGLGQSVTAARNSDRSEPLQQDRIEGWARLFLLLMALVSFGVGIAWVLTDSYGGGLLVALAVVAMYVAGKWPHVGTLHLPGGIKVEIEQGTSTANERWTLKRRAR